MSKLNYAEFGPDYWGGRPLHEPHGLYIGGSSSLGPREVGTYGYVVYDSFAL